MDAKCRWGYDRLDGAVRFREPLGQTKVMQIRERVTTHESCCLAAQCDFKIDIDFNVERFEQDFYRAVMGITIESCDHQSLFYEVRNFNKDSALRT